MTVQMNKISETCRMYDDPEGHAVVVIDAMPQLGVDEPLINILVNLVDLGVGEGSYERHEAFLSFLGWNEVRTACQDSEKHWLDFLHAVEYYERYHLPKMGASCN